ncbi:MAG: aminotransferase class I/II-fold pyridoxal phosphate-dependent enzyme, partial [Desulfovibrio sp.]|nr:aminotransferase class I/II-fold pyridoxal phosphate-dependent enzyme [Desulfovibrio sp.]
MRLLSREMDGYLAQGAWIRSIFELGLELKKKYGEDAVCDFSLGNPDLAPPPQVGKRLAEIAAAADRPFAFGYMPNPGYPQVREALAGYVSRQQACAVAAGDLVVTCGAAGAINIFFRAVLEPGDEVICPSPYFVEYGFYASNSGGVLRPVPSKPGDFGLDVAAIAAAVTDRTRAVLINSPNNPTGQIYPAGEIAELAEALARLS